MRYSIRSFGYDGGPYFATLEQARAELAIWKEEDKQACKRRFRMATVKSDADGYQVTFGINLYSASRIHAL